MNFRDPRTEGIDVSDPQAIYQLIVKDLCGEVYHKPFEDSDRQKIARFLAITSSEGLNHAQFNELLLILDQDRVTEAFFNFFFLSQPGKNRVALSEVPSCIVRFRGFAILCFGNFRFAYKSLSQKSCKDIAKALGAAAKSTTELTDQFQKRPKKTLLLEKIDRGSAWAVGYLAKKLYKKETTVLTAKIKAAPDDPELIALGERYQQLGNELAETERRALGNTDVYLTWDYMDVYVATSMRKRWEFDDTAKFVTQLFGDQSLKDLKVRYFDPTQSQCASRIDKGIVEALMLKRARCTVYMVQESDTMGKDSELASTLAQGKPVIAFVPQIDPIAHARVLRDYPLDYFNFRFLTLMTEGVFEDEKFLETVAAGHPDASKVISSFFEAVSKYRKSQPFSLWDERENAFKASFDRFNDVCSILAIAERYSSDKRADVLRDSHPLSFQVHLESGVLNGVLVVRSPEQCARVLTNILTNALDFQFQDDEKNQCILLKEEISNSPFRVVTKHEKLSNSFWNFYLTKEHHDT
jgi:hypothetical protein